VLTGQWSKNKSSLHLTHQTFSKQGWTKRGFPGIRRIGPPLGNIPYGGSSLVHRLGIFATVAAHWSTAWEYSLRWQLIGPPLGNIPYGVSSLVHRLGIIPMVAAHWSLAQFLPFLVFLSIEVLLGTGVHISSSRIPSSLPVLAVSIGRACVSIPCLPEARVTCSHQPRGE
jgi:hypothetical protein